MPPKLVVIQTEPLAPAAKQWLSERASVVEAKPGTDAFAKAAPEAAALVVRTYTEVDSRLLALLPQLRVVGRAGVGVDNIDVEACKARGIRVISTPDANTQAVVEYVTALLCDELRPRMYVERPLSDAEWHSARERVVGARQMNELRLGILGLGRIGKRMAQVAGAIGFTVAFNDVLEIPQAERCGAKQVNVQELFATSDVLTIHIDGRPSNRNFVGDTLLQLLPQNSLLLNTSRGAVLDAGALAQSLRARPQMRAVLDVHAQEPFGNDYPLLGLPNARLAPHLASRTQTAMDAMSWVVKDVYAALK